MCDIVVRCAVWPYGNRNEEHRLTPWSRPLACAVRLNPDAETFVKSYETTEIAIIGTCDFRGKVMKPPKCRGNGYEININ